MAEAGFEPETLGVVCTENLGKISHQSGVKSSLSVFVFVASLKNRGDANCLMLLKFEFILTHSEWIIGFQFFRQNILSLWSKWGSATIFPIAAITEMEKI